MTDTDLLTTANGETARAGGEFEESPVTVIESATRWPSLDLADIWRHRELLLFFAWRDLKVRYKQTELGAAWIIIQPLVSTGVFVVLFGLLMGEGKEPTAPGVPYALSTYCGIILWQLFASAVTRSGDCFLAESGLITKVYFPRLILPLSTAIAGLVDFAIAFVVLVVMMVLYGVSPGWGVIAIPACVLLAMLAALAIGLWLSTLAAAYRDFRYVQPFLIRIGMYVSPVIYATASIRDALPDWALVVYGLNPMAGAIEGFRWALFGESALPGLVLLPSAMMTVLLLLGGMYFFRHMEQTVVDVI